MLCKSVKIINICNVKKLSNFSSKTLQKSVQKTNKNKRFKSYETVDSYTLHVRLLVYPLFNKN